MPLRKVFAAMQVLFQGAELKLGNKLFRFDNGILHKRMISRNVPGREGQPVEQWVPAFADEDDPQNLQLFFDLIKITPDDQLDASILENRKLLSQHQELLLSARVEQAKNPKIAVKTPAGKDDNGRNLIGVEQGGIAVFDPLGRVGDCNVYPEEG